MCSGLRRCRRGWSGGGRFDGRPIRAKPAEYAGVYILLLIEMDLTVKEIVMDHKSSCETRRPCLSVILAAAIAFVQSAGAIPSSDTNTPAGFSAADSKVPRVKVHLSAQALQAIYLNGFRLGAQKAARAAKATSCMLSLWYTDDFRSRRGVVH